MTFGSLQERPDRDIRAEGQPENRHGRHERRQHPEDSFSIFPRLHRPVDVTAQLLHGSRNIKFDELMSETMLQHIDPRSMEPRRPGCPEGQ